MKKLFIFLLFLYFEKPRFFKLLFIEEYKINQNVAKDGKVLKIKNNKIIKF